MKIKISKKQETEQLNEFGFLAGMIVMAVIGYIANKFYSPVKSEMTAAGKAIDTASNSLQKALEGDTTPQAKNLAQKFIIEKQKFVAKMNEIKEQAADANKVTEMSDKPSVMIDREILKFQQVLEMLKAEVKKLSPNSQQAFGRATNEIGKARKLLANIDRLMLMLNKKDPNGLWMSTISKTALASSLQDEKKWKSFVQTLSSYIK